ncbi:MAG: radical SAM protein [Armatimonadota bacterium]|nr:radical SAM protein [Armatimonadota bacterium]
MKLSIEKLHPDLPVFGVEARDRHVFYAPGHAAVVPHNKAEAVRMSLLGKDRDRSSSGKLAADLMRAARTAVDDWKRRVEAPFAPRCLTVYLSNRCNLACSYCFADSGAGRADTAIVDAETVTAAARLVAESRGQAGEPFKLVLHGGGEPTVHWDLVERFVEITRREAARVGSGWFGHIATNGALPDARAQWLAKNFQSIGLSCDGPPDIQDRHRPLRGGGPSSPYIESNARAILSAGGHFAVRATIVPETVERQVDIVTYLHERLGAMEMRFEPVYRVRGSEGAGFDADQAEWFAENFLKAQQRAGELGCDLTFSGTRLDELHGPYCSALRDTLHLTPDGSATACFFSTDGRSGVGSQFVIGRMDRDAGRFVLDQTRIDELRRRAGLVPPQCRDCLNAYHCARECPEVCYSMNTGEKDLGEGFRCRVSRLLAGAWILEATERASDARQPVRTDSDTLNGEEARLREILSDAPKSVDKDEIMEQWRAARSSYRIQARPLPKPVWADGYEHDGDEAWRLLNREFPKNPAVDAISVYVHVPFCDRRCPFCDCCSVPSGTKGSAREEEYANVLLRDVDAWSGIGMTGIRPVTTVHFGGGTPNHLGAHVFGDIVERCRDRLGVTAETEWALESTSSLLTRAHLRQLREWGFTRLHVGVQTLEESVRQTIRRRESADAATARLTDALSAGFVVSVDLIYGLPGQTLEGLVSTVDRLVATGVHGVSLYQLQVSDRNRRFLERHGAAERDAPRDYVLFQAAEQVLTRHGYRKTHFTHFARPADTNLYYAHTLRGEDLLAIGATADGVFGDYHYRHPSHELYVGGSDGPVLEGGVWETPEQRRLKRVSASIMGGVVTEADMSSVGAERLIDTWLERAMVRRQCGCSLVGAPNPEKADSSFLGMTNPGDGYVLTGNGSWFVSDMLREVCEASALQVRYLEA